ncbi:hypothetical protein D9M68_583560 [compost metagenome]
MQWLPATRQESRVAIGNGDVRGGVLDLLRRFDLIAQVLQPTNDKLVLEGDALIRAFYRDCGYALAWLRLLRDAS